MSKQIKNNKARVENDDIIVIDQYRYEHES